MITQSSFQVRPWAGGWINDTRPGVRTLKSEELGLLSRILETHCSTYGIRSAEGRDSVAQSLIGYFRNGVTGEDELLARLELEDRPLEALQVRAGAAEIIIRPR